LERAFLKKGLERNQQYYCPLCGNLLLRHIQQNYVYWFCRHCRQAFPGEFVEHLSLQFNARLNARLFDERTQVLAWMDLSIISFIDAPKNFGSEE
jgi:ribosomal protein L37AE/L43A